MIRNAPLLCVRQPHNQDARVGARDEPASIRKIQILGDKKALFALSGCPYRVVVAAAEVLVEHGIDIKPERGKSRHQRARQVLVELQPQATFMLGGIGLGAGRSSAAEAAANAITARTSSSVRLGNSARIRCTGSPCAR